MFRKDGALKRDEQVPTRGVTIISVMSTPKFALGVADVRAGRPIRPDYETWDVDPQWDYERGRQWASVAPRTVALKNSKGRITPEALRWFVRGDIP